MFGIIYLIIGTLISIAGAAFIWLRNSFISAKNDRKNFYKPILLIVFYAYVFSRIQFAIDIYLDSDLTGYKSKDLTPRREQRFEKYVRLQEKTHYIDRYKNMIYYLNEDDRPILAVSVYFLTCSRRLYKFSDLVWDAHLSKLLEEKNEKKIAAYLESIKWLSDEDKAKQIQKLDSKPHN